MRKIIALLLIIMIGAVPIATAQDYELLFEPTETFTVQDLMFEFLYPEGWVFGTADGIAVAENEADLAAIEDDDDATEPAGFFMQLNVVPVEALGLEEDASLDEMVDLLIEIIELDVTERFETPVLTHRGITVIAVDPEGDGGIGSFWVQDDYLVLFRLGAPDMSDVGSIGYTWGHIILTMTSLTDLELTETYDFAGLGGFSIDYPAGWYVHEDDLVSFVQDEADYAAMQDDPDASPVNGSAVVFGSFPLGENADSVTAADLLDLVLGEDAEEVAPRREFVLFDAPAIGARAYSSDTDNYGLLIAGVVEGEAYLVLASSPTLEDLEAFTPSFIAMLQTIK